MHRIIYLLILIYLLIDFCALLRTLLPFPRPGPEKLIYFLNLLFFFVHTHRIKCFRKSLIFARYRPGVGEGACIGLGWGKGTV